MNNKQIAGIEALHKKASALIDDDTEPDIAALISHVPALCQTVRQLRKWLDDALVRAAEDQDDHSAQRATLVAQLEQVTKERDVARIGMQRTCTHPNTYPLRTATRRCHDCGLEILL